MKKWIWLFVFFTLPLFGGEGQFTGTWKVIHCGIEEFDEKGFELQSEKHEDCGLHDFFDLILLQRGKKIFGHGSFLGGSFDLEGIIQIPQKASVSFGDFSSISPKIGTAEITFSEDKITWDVINNIKEDEYPDSIPPTDATIFRRPPLEGELEELRGKNNPLNQDRKDSALYLAERFSVFCYDGSFEKAYRLAETDYQQKLSLADFAMKFEPLLKKDLVNLKFFPIGDQHGLVLSSVGKPSYGTKFKKVLFFLNRKFGWKIRRIDTF